MSSSPQSRNDFAFPWAVDHQPKSNLIEGIEKFYRLCHLRWRIVLRYGGAARPVLNRVGRALDQTVLATALIVLPKVFAGWDKVRPALASQARALMPFLPFDTAEGEALKRDPIWELLADFKALSPEQQDKAARNLALLWGHFEDSFGGLSRFLDQPRTEQTHYLDKLATASRRMRLARGSEVAFHYVTVELMRQYVGCFQAGRSDRAALSVATCVATLINRGRMMTPAIAPPAMAA